MAEPIGIEFQVVGAQQVTGAMAQMETRARAMSSAMTSGLAPARQAVSALSSVLSNTATILRLTGQEGQGLARHMEGMALAVSTAAVAVQTLRGVSLSLTATMVALRAAMVGVGAIAATIVAVLTAPFTIALAATAALAVGLAFLDQRFREVKVSAHEAALSLREYAAMATGGIEATERLRQRVKDLALTESDWAKIRRFAARDSMELPEIQGRLAEEARRAADAQRRLNAAMAEARFQEVVRQTTEVVGGLRMLEEGTRAFGDALQRTNNLRAAELAMAIALQRQQERYPRVLQDIAAGYQAVTEKLKPVVDWLDLIRLSNEQAIQAIEDRMEQQRRAASDLTEQTRRQAEVEAQAVADLIETANRQAIEAIEERMEAQRRAAEETVSRLEDMQRRAKAAIQPLADAFSTLFTDILMGAKSFGESLTDFFRNIVNQIANLFAQRIARWIVGGLLGFAKGGIVSGGLVPVGAMQHGGIVTGPTLAMIGEGRRAEAVVPLPDNRSIPVKFTGEGREREIVVHVNVLFDPNQIPRTGPGEITATVMADLRSGGPLSRTIRQVVR